MPVQANIPTLETIQTTAATFHLSEYSVRKLARSKEGKRFTVKVGAKYFINQEKFLAFLNCEDLPDTTNQNDSTKNKPNGITPIPIKL